jgi:threonine synthase
VAAGGVIAIDVGHYREAPGVTSAHGRPEFEFNRDLASEIEAQLQARGRSTQLIGAAGEMSSLPARPRAAAGAALFVSVHHDSMQASLLSSWTYEGVERRYGEVVDPHTADGLAVAEAWREPGVPMICLETALPAKFAQTSWLRRCRVHHQDQLRLRS